MHRVVVPSRFGDFAIEGDRWAVTRLVLPGQGEEWKAARHRPDPVPACLHDAQVQLTDYLGGGRSGFDLPLRARGTAFQHQVWAGLAAVGYGQTVSYAEMAATINRPTAARAVGRAVGANPLPVFVPCHRVVAAGGGLGGYAGGRDLKAALLDLESGGARAGRRVAAVS
ncbi:MAG: methylated-DNA--[protein]-cysteine S-methyltransferase [Acidimicrobiales bacterium]